MPRGATKDEAMTKMLRENGTLQDKRSFVSLPFKTPGAHSDGPHLFLYGIDMTLQRGRVLIRAGFSCECRPAGSFGDIWHSVGLELDHIQSGTAHRCDCMANLRMVCKECHHKRHVHVRFKEAR